MPGLVAFDVLILAPPAHMVRLPSFLAMHQVADATYPSTSLIDQILATEHSATAVFLSNDWLKALAVDELAAVSARLANAGYMLSFCTASHVVFEVLACTSTAPSGRFNPRNITQLIGAAAFGAGVAISVGRATVGAFCSSAPPPQAEGDNVSTATADDSPLQPIPGPSNKYCGKVNNPV